MRSVTQERSPSERGASWSAPEEVCAALAVIALRSSSSDSAHARGTAAAVDAVSAPPSQSLLDRGDAPGVLGRIWRGLVVRVMSARNHDFGNAVANSFYTQEVSFWCGPTLVYGYLLWIGADWLAHRL
jgi:hypothetical protein